MSKKKSKSKKEKSEEKFDKHKYYEMSVQNPEYEVKFLKDTYKKIRKKNAVMLREDFGGTGYLSCEWVKLNSEHKAMAIDLDSDPITWGKKHHYDLLTPEQKKRMTYIQKNVMEMKSPKADIVCAFNFSYFIFKKRKTMLEYFKSVRSGLNSDGIFLIDLFGGPDSQTVMVEETDHKKFSYYWDCVRFDAITNECFFAIHFKDKSGKKHKNCFTYDWRLWTLAELRDILEEAGFSKTIPYWEGDGKDGTGDGDFYPTESEENCLSWIAYIAALP